MPEHPASEGALCSKGNAALEILYHPDRLQHPLKRKGDGWTRISWKEALELTARGLGGALKRFGPECVGFSPHQNALMRRLPYREDGPLPWI